MQGVFCLFRLGRVVLLDFPLLARLMIMRYDYTYYLSVRLINYCISLGPRWDMPLENTCDEFT